MQVTETQSDGLKRSYRIVIEAAEMTSRIDARFDELKRNSRLKGFRPGKAPMNLLRKQFGTAVVQEVLQDAVKNSSEAALEQREIRQASPAMVEDLSFDQGDDLEYVLNVEVMPDITPADFASLSVEHHVIGVSAEDVDGIVDMIARLCGTRDGVDGESGGLADGDMVLLDLEVTAGGQAVESLSGKGFQFRIGDGVLPDEVSAALKGRSPGETLEVGATIPENLRGAGDDAGAEGLYGIRIAEAFRPVPHPLDDGLAGLLEAESLDELRTLAEDEARDRFGSLSRERAKRALLDRLAESHSFDVPPSFVDNEFQAIWAQVGSFLEKEKSGDELQAEREEYRGIAERRVRLGLLLSEIGRSAGIEVSQADMQAALVGQASRFPGREAQVVRYYQENPQDLRRLAAPALEDRVVGHVLDQVVLDDREVDLAAFLALEGEEGEAGLQHHRSQVALTLFRNRYKGAGEDEAGGEETAP